MKWAEIDGFPDYQVSSSGVVRRSNDGVRVAAGGILGTVIGKNDGYERIGIYKNGKRYSRYVHRLVASAFISKIGPGLQVNHINGIRHDNRVENLEIVTPSQNVRDQIKKRPSVYPDRKGEKSFSTGLTKKDVMAIRGQYASGGATQKEIGDKYGITQNAVSKIVTRSNWSHI